MGMKLKVIRRKEPFAMISLRIDPDDKARIEKCAAENQATVTDIVISALVQTGVIPAEPSSAVRTDGKTAP